ncbi:vigilin [Nephila pilipes]|uniref:Vigilin n=1 Tax=Nephila pilipes TaxID=299642 RepID=A0A8X6PR02_NEPPI|nr:vigilin [Nephila pilipes]
MTDGVTIYGKEEAEAKAKARIQNIHERLKRNCQNISVEVPKNQHKYIIGPRGQTIQEILQKAGVSVEMPSSDVQSVTITLRGEQTKLGPVYALTLIYSKTNSVKTGHMDVPSWLNIGGKRFN